MEEQTLILTLNYKKMKTFMYLVYFGLLYLSICMFIETLKTPRTDLMAVTLTAAIAISFRILAEFINENR